jgi:hypothetical protein
LSAKTRLLILIVFVGVVLFAIFYYLVGINYPYVIRYPILVATVILFIVIVATLALAMGRRVGVPLPSSALKTSRTATFMPGASLPLVTPPNLFKRLLLNSGFVSAYTIGACALHENFVSQHSLQNK